jgi:dTDP-4-dehydrorhamnose 3,5-epimerase
MPGNPNPVRSPRPTAIDGVLIQELSWYSDARGSLSVLLRNDQRELLGGTFGQLYVTTVVPGVVKAWHRHKEQWDRMVGLVGRTLLVLVDGRPDSGTRGAQVAEVLGERHPQLVLIPPGVWHGLSNLGAAESLVLNVPTRPYAAAAPDEERADPHSSPVPGSPPWDWTRRDG